jgi:hypothetical protein
MSKVFWLSPDLNGTLNSEMRPVRLELWIETLGWLSNIFTWIHSIKGSKQDRRVRNEKAKTRLD